MELNPFKNGWAALIVAYVLIALGYAIGSAIDGEVTFTIKDNVGFFAAFYVVAQAVERFLEPFANVLGVGDKEKAEKEKKTEQDNKKNAEKELEIANLSFVSTQDVNEKTRVRQDIENATNARDQADSEIKKNEELLKKLGTNRAILYWGAASCFAVIASAGLNLQFLAVIGFSGHEPWVDTVVTGMVIGGGTKPLHDLIQLIEKGKESANHS